MPAMAKSAEMNWVLSPKLGVKRKLLERIGGEKVSRATSIVKYDEGASFDSHIHTGGEEFFVLDGTFSDETGNYPAGWYVRNPPGTQHKPFSNEGCQIFVKLGQIHWSDKVSVRLDTNAANRVWQDCEKGCSSLLLHKNLFERVSLIRWPRGLKLEPNPSLGGLEIFVLKGRFVDDFGDHHKGDWIRIPAGHGHRVRALEDTLLYVKTGHLR
ncbi:MAG TPA: cupin [Hellea balneolensis]|uniref:Cupin n=1 Tax=Hellea balneolensis TaxID=287478 RepID=A0A7C5QZS2_9PROT|nr:cupin [Hellea balneolensis]